MVDLAFTAASLGRNSDQVIHLMHLEAAEMVETVREMENGHLEANGGSERRRQMK